MLALHHIWMQFPLVARAAEGRAISLGSRMLDQNNRDLCLIGCVHSLRNLLQTAVGIADWQFAGKIFVLDINHQQCALHTEFPLSINGGAFREIISACSLVWQIDSLYYWPATPSTIS